MVRLNRYGVDVTKNVHEIWNNPLYRYDDYDITERVGAGYIMNTLNLGQFATIIAGVRVEQEDNDYVAGYMPRLPPDSRYQRMRFAIQLQVLHKA